MTANTRSSEELTLIYKGATVTDLAQIFDMTPQEVNKRLSGNVVPVTASGRAPRYAIRDAAPRLCNVVFDVEEFLKKLSPAKLPPNLQDAFWKAQNSRQDFELRKGDLWSTDRVIEVFAEVFKTIRMTVQMFSDNLEQQTELTPRQREILQRIGDGLLDMAYKNLVKDFADRVAAHDEHGRSLHEEEPGAGTVDVVEEEEPPFDDGFGD